MGVAYENFTAFVNCYTEKLPVKIFSVLSRRKFMKHLPEYWRNYYSDIKTLLYIFHCKNEFGHCVDVEVKNFVSLRLRSDSRFPFVAYMTKGIVFNYTF